MNKEIVSEEIEEYLEATWISRERREETAVDFAMVDEIVNLDRSRLARLHDELRSTGFIETEDGKVTLSSKGEKVARNVIRRHRLAERLFVDVLDMDFSQIEGPACQFEHAISSEVEEKICTLLGHPEECPHGRPIPRGECCERSDETIESAIKRLTDLDVGARGRVVYVSSSDESRLKKLSSFGLVPGALAQVVQKFPSFVLQIEEMQLAVEKRVAGNIYVREYNRDDLSNEIEPEAQSFWSVLKDFAPSF